MAILSTLFFNAVFVIKELLDPDHNSVIRLNNERYIVEKKLGEGGFAFVYLVKRIRTGDKFALKRVRIQLTEQQTVKEIVSRWWFRRDVDENITRLSRKRWLSTVLSRHRS
jgi:serine/threonine protein kinase